MTPPQRLRHELEVMRERGYTFSMAWPAAVSASVRDENVHSGAFWRSVFNEQRGCWACAYSRRRWPKNMRPGLEMFDDDHSTPAARTRAPALA